ncbi:hypothetical protein B0H14DRAFT_2562975 [Mycena olivaceomarginata]|nr:hypothetical protein B0H14DRAFT_2562975 [Mycena olivaceomarginata]
MYEKFSYIFGPVTAVLLLEPATRMSPSFKFPGLIWSLSVSASVCSTIESLHFDSTDHGIESLDLSIFPVLKHLTSDGMEGGGGGGGAHSTPFSPPFHRTTPSTRYLSYIPRRLLVWLRIYLGWLKLPRDLISHTLKLPVLRRMELEMAPETLYFYYNATELRKRFQRDLSQIHERGRNFEKFILCPKRTSKTNLVPMPKLMETAKLWRCIGADPNLCQPLLSWGMSLLQPLLPYISPMQPLTGSGSYPSGAGNLSSRVHTFAILHGLVHLKHVPTEIRTSNVS